MLIEVIWIENQVLMKMINIELGYLTIILQQLISSQNIHNTFNLYMTQDNDLL